MGISVKSRLILGTVFTALAASSASAASVDLAYVSTNPGFTEAVSTNSGSTFVGYDTGQMKFAISNNVGATLLPTTGNLLTFCVELTGGISSSPNTFQVLGPGTGSFVSPLTAAKGNALTAFFNQYYTTSLTPVQLDAFQLDIWELLMDTAPGSLLAGNFQIKYEDSAVTQGNIWLNNFVPGTTGPIQLLQLQSGTLQDQITIGQGVGAPPSTPLPPALPGGLALMIGAAAFGKFRRRNH